MLCPRKNCWDAVGALPLLNRVKFVASLTDTSALTLQSAARNTAAIPEVNSASLMFSTQVSGASWFRSGILKVPFMKPTAARTSESARSGPAYTS